MLPLMVMVCYYLGNLSKLPNTVCNRFKQPLMEMVCLVVSTNCLVVSIGCLVMSTLWTEYVTAYDNGISSGV
jgi:hypothetical protein